MTKERAQNYFVDLWYGDILLTETDEIQTKEQYWSILNREEKKRASLFKHPILQSKFIKTRAVLKKILSGYLAIRPENLNIETTEFGKPYINVNYGLYFNLSHQGNRFVIAVSNIEQIGVDIEQCNDRKNMPSLVKKCFSTEEEKFWFSLPAKQQTQMFYRFWVRKEAFVKAVGRGITLGLNQCVIDPNHQSRFLSLPFGYGSAKEWKILNITLNDNDICAVVLKNIDFKFNKKPWHD